MKRLESKIHPRQNHRLTSWYTAIESMWNRLGIGGILCFEFEWEMSKSILIFIIAAFVGRGLRSSFYILDICLIDILE